jgi:hypothetical protein
MLKFSCTSSLSFVSLDWAGPRVDSPEPGVVYVVCRGGCKVGGARSPPDGAWPSIIATRRAFHTSGDVCAAIEGRLPRDFGVTHLTDAPMELSAQWLALGLAASTVNGSQQTSMGA